jgi:hypothetical protein
MSLLIINNDCTIKNPDAYDGADDDHHHYDYAAERPIFFGINLKREGPILLIEGPAR